MSLNYIPVLYDITNLGRLYALYIAKKFIKKKSVNGPKLSYIRIA